MEKALAFLLLAMKWDFIFQFIADNFLFFVCN